MKQCRECSVNLVVGENWTANSQKYWDYKCKPCKKEYIDKYRNKPGRKEQEKINDKKTYEKNKHTIVAIKDKSKRRIKAGIYGIFSDCKLIYIGESKQPLSRSHNHFSISKKRNYGPVSYALSNGEIQRDKLRFKMLEFIDDTDTRKAQEQRLIQRYKPIYNDNHMYRHKQ